MQTTRSFQPTPRCAGVMLLFAISCGLSAAEFEQRIVSSGFCYERAIGDLDGDGRNEVVAVAPQTSPLQGARGLVRLRAPDWQPEPLINFTEYGDQYVFWRCDDVIIADVNGDGRMDIVGALGTEANTGITRLTWWENPGQTALRPPAWKRHFVQGVASEKNYIKNLHVEDMDGDGRADIVVRIQKRLAVYFQDSADSWVEKGWDIEPFEGMGVGRIAGGRRPDIAVNGAWYESPANPRTRPYVRHIYAQKWLDPARPIPRGFNAPGTKIVIVDLDADGREDIVVSPAEYGSKYMPLARYSSRTPKEGPWIEHVIEPAVQQTHSLRVADFNGDGRLDVITGGMRPLTNPDKGLWVYLQSADHSFRRVDIQANDTDKGAYSIAVGDLDGDGLPDVANSRSYDIGPTEIWFNRLMASARPPNKRTAGPPSGEHGKATVRPLDRWHYIQADDTRTKRMFGLAMGDATGDGFPDIAAGQWFYRNPGGDLTGKWERVDLPDGVDAIAIVDVNGNDRGDIIALKPNAQFWLEANDREGGSWTTHQIGSLPLDDHKLGSQVYALAQVIPGGKPEIVIAGEKGTWILQIPANPKAGPWPAVQVSAEGTGGAVGDIDGDGWPDIAGSIRGQGEGDILPGSRGARKNNHTVCWWKNPGPAGGSTALTAGGTWKRIEVGFAIGADRYAVGDVNGDGRPDIIISDERFPGSVPNADLQWYENSRDTDRTWVRHVVATQMSMNSLDVADIDNDGDLDLVTCEHRMPDQRGEVVPNKERLQIWENDGRGNFTARTLDTGKESHLGARLADLDGDGDLDIVSIAWRNFQYLHLWRNDAVQGPVPAIQLPRSGVRLTSHAGLPGCPGLDFFRIETPAGAYYLDKRGAAIAAIVDRDGHDWIGFRSEPFSRSAGEFRGFPNAVGEPAGAYFHPLNRQTSAAHCRVEQNGPDRVSIAAESDNGLWAGRYDFFATHCTFTMTKMPPNESYWILYEGTPGGGYDDTDWWMTSAINERQPMTKNHEGDIRGPEWIAFGDPKLNRVLFLLNHEDDAGPDRFYQMQKEMTVFGFGRHRGEKHLRTVPRSFSIGLLETTAHGEISRAMTELLAEK